MPKPVTATANAIRPDVDSKPGFMTPIRFGFHGAGAWCAHTDERGCAGAR
jgi:hypothetical protein